MSLSFLPFLVFLLDILTCIFKHFSQVVNEQSLIHLSNYETPFFTAILLQFIASYSTRTSFRLVYKNPPSPYKVDIHIRESSTFVTRKKFCYYRRSIKKVIKNPFHKFTLIMKTKKKNILFYDSQVVN